MDTMLSHNALGAESIQTALTAFGFSSLMLMNHYLKHLFLYLLKAVALGTCSNALNPRVIY